MDEKKSVEKLQHLTFRPTPKIKKLLEEAQRATGADRSELILECIEEALDKVVQREVESQLKEAQARAAALKSGKAAS